MRLYSYIVTHDSGFAPNPFWGRLTLACCKPQIRKTARPGDLIVGLSSARHDNSLIFIARVEEKLTFREYWLDERFLAKRPNSESTFTIDRCGDNIYEPLGRERYRQLPSGHSNGLKENEPNKRHDLGGRFVLVCSDYTYFGGDPLALPDRFRALVAGRGHRCRFPDDLVADVDVWRRMLPHGVQARPRMWKEGDTSWIQER